MEDLFKAFLIVALVECIIANWCILSISLELKNIRKEFEKKKQKLKVTYDTLTKEGDIS